MKITNKKYKQFSPSTPLPPSPSIRNWPKTTQARLVGLVRIEEERERERERDTRRLFEKFANAPRRKSTIRKFDESGAICYADDAADTDE
jgi:hypothetical protein